MLDLVDEFTEPGPQLAAYPPPPRWVTSNGWLLIAALRKSTKTLSIYVNIISKAGRVAPSYIENLIAEMDLLEVAHGRFVQQLHWGGTPGYLDPQQRVELFNAMVTRFPLIFGADVSLGFHKLDRNPVQPVHSSEYAPLPETDLVGFGVGATSHVGNTYVQNFRNLEDYEDAIASDHLPVSRGFIEGKAQ